LFRSRAAAEVRNHWDVAALGLGHS
jgi:hypothetical protein